MKKLVAVLMVSLFAVSVFAAPALEISGTLNAGVRGEFNKETQKVFMFSDDYDAEGVGAALTLDGSYSDENYGVEFEVGVENTSFAFGYAYAWASLFDDVLSFKAGAISDDTWTTVGDQELTFAEVTGLQLLISPFEGLNFGASLALISDSEDEIALAKNLAKSLAFGASYTGETISAQVGYSLADAGALYAGFGYEPENFFFAVDALMSAVTNYSEEGETIISETVSYAFNDAFALDLVCYQTLVKDANEFSFEPCANYAINDTFNAYFGLGFTLADTNNYYVQPGIEIAISPNALINCYYELSGDVEGSLDNAIQFDFVWNF